jgi:hypothetical protein
MAGPRRRQCHALVEHEGMLDIAVEPKTVRFECPEVSRAFNHAADYCFAIKLDEPGDAQCDIVGEYLRCSTDALGK